MARWLSGRVRLEDHTDAGTAGIVRNIKRVENQYQSSQRVITRTAGIATGGMGKLNASYSGVIGTLGNFGSAGLAAAAGIGLVTLAGQRSYRQFRELRTEVKKAAGIAGGEIRKVTADLERQAKDISIKWAQPLQQEAWATYQALSGAVQYGQLGSFMDASGRFVRAEFLDDFSAGVDLLTTVTNSYGKSARNTGAVVDVLSETIKYGKVTAQQLGETMSTVTPLAAALGIELEQVTAGIAAMTSQGVNASEATTYIRRFLIEVSDTSSKAHEHFKRITGQGFAEYIEAGNTISQAAGEFRKDAEAQGRSIDEYFGRVQASQAALVLSSEAGTKRYQQSYEALSDSFGSAARKAWANMDESYVTVEALGAKFNSTMAGIGSGIGDVIDFMIGWTVQSGDMRYASDLTTQALQTEEAAVQQLIYRYMELEDWAPSGTRRGDTDTERALHQLMADLNISSGSRQAGIDAYRAAYGGSGTYTATGFLTDSWLPGGDGSQASGSLLGLLSGGRTERNAAWQALEEQIGETLPVELKRIIEEAAQSARSAFGNAGAIAEREAADAGVEMVGFAEQVMNRFLRDGPEAAEEILSQGLVDTMRVIMNRAPDIAAEVIRGFIETGPGSGLLGRVHPGMMRQAGGQFMTGYNQMLYRNSPAVQSAMAGGIGGLEAFGGYGTAGYVRDRAYQPGGTWYEQPDKGSKGGVSALARFREELLETVQHQANYNETWPSYQNALGDMSSDTEELARRAAELGLAFDDLTEAERQAFAAVEGRAAAEAERAAADEIRSFRREIVDTVAEQRRFNETWPSYTAALGKMYGETETLARRAAALGITHGELTAAEQRAIEAIDLRTEADHALAEASKSAASALSRIRSVSAGYNFDSSGRVTGRTTSSEQIKRQIDKDQAAYGGIQHDLDRLNEKLGAGRHKPDQEFKTGEFAGFTLNEAIDFTKERQRSRGVYEFVKGEEDAAAAEKARKAAEARAAAAKRAAEERARKEEAARQRAERVQDIRFDRKDISKPDYINILENRLATATERFGKFSPEEHAIWTRMQDVLEEIEENTRPIEEFLHLLVGASVTSATAGWDRSYQTPAGTRAVALDEHRRIKELVHG